MARNYTNSGDIVEVAAPSGGITAGQGMQLGVAVFGVALNTAAEGAPVQLKRSGLFTMAKTSALAITAGDLLYWDATNKVVNKTTAGQRAVGVALAGAANPSPTVHMLVGVNSLAGT